MRLVLTGGLTLRPPLEPLRAGILASNINFAFGVSTAKTSEVMINDKGIKGIR